MALIHSAAFETNGNVRRSEPVPPLGLTSYGGQFTIYLLSSYQMEVFTPSPVHSTTVAIETNRPSYLGSLSCWLLVGFKSLIYVSVITCCPPYDEAAGKQSPIIRSNNSDFALEKTRRRRKGLTLKRICWHLKFYN